MRVSFSCEVEGFNLEGLGIMDTATISHIDALREVVTVGGALPNYTREPYTDYPMTVPYGRRVYDVGVVTVYPDGQVLVMRAAHVTITARKAWERVCEVLGAPTLAAWAERFTYCTRPTI